jgi:1,4-dihydroxy-2-naphthoyl-CoA hydrolase
MDDFADELNRRSTGWNAAMGMRFVKATPNEVIAEIAVADHHLQPYGIVHGGVHAGVIEALCSIGAALVALPRGQTVVGLENSTSFLRAVRHGTLRAVATPLTTGRRAQVWECTISGDDGKAAATGRVRLMCLDPGAAIAGEPAGIKET